MIDAYRRRSFTCPNYTPKEWWECDVFELTKAGYFREYEIKLSRADFRADKLKVDRRFDYDTCEYRARVKHDLLAGSSTEGPNYFWFVCPKGMLHVSEIPTWAGLIEAEQRPHRSQLILNTIKQAPKLHGEKLHQDIRGHLFRTYYHRFQHWFLFERKEAA